MCTGCCRLNPLYVLVFLTLINVLIYTDRGVLAAVASTIESKSEGLGLSVEEIGAVGSLFMLGYMIAGPFFAHYSQRCHPLNLIAIGLTVWGLATTATGYSKNFWMLGISRAFTGVGEASFVCLAPPYILDHAPSSSKTTWIAIFYSAISIGNAVGYVYGNVMNEMLGGWYWPFYFESVLIIPFILVCLFGKKESLHINPETSEEKQEIIGVCDQIKLLGKNLTYDFIVLGFAAFIFSMGGLSLWGPYIVEKLFNQSPRNANMSLGIIILTSGILGTLMGSFLFDFFMRKYVQLGSSGKITKETLTHITTEKANLFLFITTFFSMIFGILGLLFDSYLIFKICIWFFLFLMYMNKGPIAISIMSCVPSSLRGQANAMAIFFMHAFGDFPSPFIIGYIISYDLYWGVMVTILWLAWAVLFWVIAWNVSRFYGKDNGYIIKNFCKSISGSDIRHLMSPSSNNVA